MVNMVAWVGTWAIVRVDRVTTLLSLNDGSHVGDSVVEKKKRDDGRVAGKY